MLLRFSLLLALTFPAPAVADSVRAGSVAELEAAISGEADEIILESGLYRLSKPLIISRPLILKAAPGATPVLTGAHAIAGSWKTVETGVWQIEVPPEFGEIRTVFRRATDKLQPPIILPRASSPGLVVDEDLPPEVPYRNRRAIDGNHAYLPLEAFSTHDATAPGAELRIIPKFPWLMGILPIDLADPTRRLVQTSVPMIYDLSPPAFGFFDQGSAWIENTLAVMDQPDEWVFDSINRVLFLRSEKDPANEIEVARLTELIRIEGKENKADYTDIPVKGVKLEGLTFTGAKRFAWTAKKTGWGLQHDWEMYDRSTAMVRMRFTENCEITNCEFTTSGAAGLRMDLHAIGNKVSRCTFDDLGGVGALLAGYGLGYKDVNHSNEISDCRFNEIGTEWWASPAIFVWQSGSNRIVHNTIESTPYTGIVVSTRTQPSPTGLKEGSRTIRIDEVINHFETHGRDWKAREPLMHGRGNEIAWNRITGVMSKLSDGNAIYLSGTGSGNRIHHNLIIGVDSQNINANIRIDDDQHESIVKNNAIVDCTGEGFVVKGRNIFKNNVVWKLRQQTRAGKPTYFARGYLIISANVGKGTAITNNIFVHDSTRHPAVFERTEPWYRQGVAMKPVLLSQTTHERNLWASSSHPNWSDNRPSFDADATFKAPMQGDFRIAKNSKALTDSGFAELDLRKAGVR